MAKRRDHGEGSIFQRERDGKWIARLDYGYVEGKRKRVERTADTKTEARLKLAEMKKDKEKGIQPEAHKQTLERFAKGWLETVKANRSYSTHKRHERIYRLHLAPTFASHTLPKVTPQLIQEFLTKTAQEKTNCTAWGAYDTLRLILNAAVKLRLLPNNPTAFVDPPRYKPKKRPIFSLEEAQRFLKCLEGKPYEAMYLVAVSLGLRRGELIGLRWADINLDKAVLNVRHSLQWRAQGREHVNPKTDKGTRTIPLPAFLVKALRQHRAAQLQTKLLAGPNWRDTDAVFSTGRGTPLGAAILNQRLTRLLKEANLPHLRLHDLRHCCASFLLAQGCQARQVQEILGHARIEITLGTYGHLIKEQERETTEKMESFLYGTG